MEIILTCGHVHSRYTLAHDILTKVGVVNIPCHKHEEMAPSRLQEKIYKTYISNTVDRARASQQRSGKVWQDLVNDKSMDGINCMHWGWASDEEIERLDAWKESNPDIRFLLAYSSPELTIRQLLCNKNEKTLKDIEYAINSWICTYKILLQFYVNNPQRCVLVNTEAAAYAPRNFVKSVSAAFKIVLHDLPSDYCVEHQYLEGLGYWQSEIKKGQEVIALYNELEHRACLNASLHMTRMTKHQKLPVNAECISGAQDLNRQVLHNEHTFNKKYKKQKSLFARPLLGAEKNNQRNIRLQEKRNTVNTNKTKATKSSKRAIRKHDDFDNKNNHALCFKHQKNPSRNGIEQQETVQARFREERAEAQLMYEKELVLQNERLKEQLNRKEKELKEFIAQCELLKHGKNQNFRGRESLPALFLETRNFGPEDEQYKEFCCAALECTQCREISQKIGDFQFESDPVTSILLYNSNQIRLDDTKITGFFDWYKNLQKKKSEDAEIKEVVPIPKDWPLNLRLSSLPDSTNDFLWQMKRIPAKNLSGKNTGLSIIVPTFNRAKILEITLACLVNQNTNHQFEVIVADDGSQDDLRTVTRKYENHLDIKLVRQRDYGYQLCAVRNLGIRSSKYRFLAILDCDMAPGKNWVQSYMELLMQSEDVALIGPRKYIDTSTFHAEDFLNDSNLLASLPEVVTNNNVAGKVNEGISVDWRLEHFRETENLRLCDTPFRYFSGGNVAFSKKWISAAGWFDEEFTHWGGEDNEFGYRLYRAGCFFRAVEGGLAYHQEPPGKENETDRVGGKEITKKIVEEKVPYFYRKLPPIEKAVLKKVPLVSIYIPVYNNSKYIEKAVNSALSQTVTDLEVCICDDGSADDTLAVLQKSYGNNPRVRFITKENGGIASASNAAVKMCRGYYIGQLDSDDYLEPDAVELCLKEFTKDRRLVCVYTTNRNVDPDGKLISKGYNWPVYSREKLTTAMICHHFRMFTARAWNLTNGFDEKLTNAVDYDMYLKLSEVGPFLHLNKVCYNRVLHGENTSILNLNFQKNNHFCSINNSLKRQGIGDFKFTPQNPEAPDCRKYTIVKV